MKVAYFGYDFFYKCLDPILEKGHEVCAMFSFETDGKYNHNENIFRFAEKFDLPVRLEKPTNEDIERLAADGCDLLISAAYPFKIPLPSIGLKGVNVHPTMLPNGRGPWPLPHLILNHSQYTGVTIHKLSTLFDRGDILIQQAINIEPSETLETLSAKTQLLAHDLMGAVLEKFDNLWTSAVPQEDGSYWLRPTNEEQTISWHDSIDLISRKVRAFGKFDTNAVIEGVKYFVHDVGVWKCEHSFVPGAVVHRMNREIVVAASDGFVCVRFFEQVTE